MQDMHPSIYMHNLC